MKLSFVGSGNVATHLSQAFFKAGHTILSIYSRNEKTGRALAKKINANFCSAADSIDLESEIVILAVPDDEIKKVAEILSIVLQRGKTILCHTSGTTDIHVLSRVYRNSGILYPLQSFSIQKSVNIKNVPFCINGENDGITATLMQLAESISEHVVPMDDAARKVLHIAAVFANNFSNYMYVISESICKDAGLDFNILRPLIQMTTEKIMEHDPSTMQTGPAKRNDSKVIREHLEFLEKYPEFRKIYESISEAIVSKHHEDHS